MPTVCKKSKRPLTVNAVISVLSALALFSSCCQKELVGPEVGDGILRIEYLWGEGKAPAVEGMTVCFFPLTDNERIWRFDIAGSEGGYIELPYGRYQMLTFNNDVPHVSFQDKYAAETYSAELTPADGCVTPIKAIYSAFVSEICFHRGSLSFALSEAGKAVSSHGENPVLTITPEKLTTTFRIVVRNVPEIDMISEASLCLHGITRRLVVYDHRPSGGSVALVDDFVIHPDTRTFEAGFESFMCMPDSEEILLDVTYRLGDHRFSKTFDVTRAVRENINPESFVIIELDGKDFPVSGEEGDYVGSTVDIDGWTNIIIDYETELK